ncbi:hypothetical protein VTO42DRAFT_3680 [Malbranchea cinnamomea]
MAEAVAKFRACPSACSWASVLSLWKAQVAQGRENRDSLDLNLGKKTNRHIKGITIPEFVLLHSLIHITLVFTLPPNTLRGLDSFHQHNYSVAFSKP